MRIVLFDLGDTLVSDFDMPDKPDQIPSIRQRYFAILDRLGIRSFFEPVSERVTLSTEVGVFKPDKRIFQSLLARWTIGYTR